MLEKHYSIGPMKAFAQSYFWHWALLKVVTHNLQFGRILRDVITFLPVVSVT